MLYGASTVEEKALRPADMRDFRETHKAMQGRMTELHKLSRRVFLLDNEEISKMLEDIVIKRFAELSAEDREDLLYYLSQIAYDAPRKPYGGSPWTAEELQRRHEEICEDELLLEKK